MPARGRPGRPKYVMISVVAERYDIHPQTLRLYEREGLIKPARSSGNTRLYDEEAIRRLEIILALTRDLGVNLAGVEVILSGMAKGAGMIAPDMATMLAFVFTDAPIASTPLQSMLSKSVQRSFNAITVDSEHGAKTQVRMRLSAGGESLERTRLWRRPIVA